MKHQLLTITRVLFASSILALPVVVHAFKIDTHLWVGQQVYNDVSDDGQITVKLRGRAITIPLSAEVAGAIRNNKDAFLMGNMGPDALPDVVAGQMVLHPGIPNGWKTNDWLTHLLNKAQGSSVGTALAYGFLSHASADVFSHTYVNQYAGDIFSLLDGETLVEQRHVALEAFIGKYTPPYLDANGTNLGQPYALVVPRDDVAAFVRDNLIYDPQASDEFSKSPSTKHLPAYLAYRNRILDASKSDLWNRIDAGIIQVIGSGYGYNISAGQAGALVNYLNTKVIPAIQNQQDVGQQMLSELNGLASQTDTALGNSVITTLGTLGNLQATINQKLLERAQKNQQVCIDVSRTVCSSMPWPLSDLCNTVTEQQCAVPTAALEVIAQIDSEINSARQQQLATAKQLRDRAVIIRDSSADLAQRLFDLAQIMTSNTSPVKAILNNWVGDLDLAMAEYVKAASNSMINTMNPAARSLPNGSITPMVNWFDCYHLTLIGVPSPVGTGACGFRGQLDKSLKALNDIISIVEDATNLGTYVNPNLGLPTPAEVRAAVTDLQAQAKKALTDAAITEVKKLLPDEVRNIIAVLSEDMTDSNLTAYYTKAETTSSKRLVMIPDIVERIKAEMHLTTAGTFDPEQYAVVYDAVVFGKLALLDNAGLTMLAQEAGVPLNGAGAPLFNGIDNVVAHAVASIDGNHQWMNVAPPYAGGTPFRRAGDSNKLAGYPWSNGYASPEGLVLWAPEARSALFRSLFIGPLSPGLEAPEELKNSQGTQFGQVLPTDYPYRPCGAYPFPNDENDRSCNAIKALPAILELLLD